MRSTKINKNNFSNFLLSVGGIKTNLISFLLNVNNLRNVLYFLVDILLINSKKLTGWIPLDFT